MTQRDLYVSSGRKVEVELVLKVEGVVQEDFGKAPVVYVHGDGTLLPALQDAMTGMRPEETKVVRIPMEKAYGPYRREAVQEVPRPVIPTSERIVPGEFLTLIDKATGQDVPVRVVEVKGDSLVLDMNHPLAGKDLEFEVRIVSIE